MYALENLEELRKDPVQPYPQIKTSWGKFLWNSSSMIYLKEYEKIVRASMLYGINFQRTVLTSPLHFICSATADVVT